MPYGAGVPTASDQLAGQPGPDRRARERSDSRLLRALPRRRRSRSVARPSFHRYAASDLRGPRLSLERHRNQRERQLRIWIDQQGRCRAELAALHLLSHARKRPRRNADRSRRLRHARFFDDRRSRCEGSSAFRRLRASVRRSRNHRRDGLRLFLLADPARGRFSEQGLSALRDLVPVLGLAIKSARPGGNRENAGKGLSRARRFRAGAARAHLARRHRAHQRGAVVFRSARLDRDRRKPQRPARSFRFSTITPRPPSTPSTMRAATC